jgi:hypothetical protein
VCEEREWQRGKNIKIQLLLLRKKSDRYKHYYYFWMGIINDHFNFCLLLYILAFPQCISITSIKVCLGAYYHKKSVILNINNKLISILFIRYYKRCSTQSQPPNRYVYNYAKDKKVLVHNHVHKMSGHLICCWLGYM